MKTIDPPETLETSATDVDREIFKVDFYEYMKQQNILKANLESFFTLIFGRCTKLAHMQLEGLKNWGTVGRISNIITLLNMVHSMSHHTTDQKYHPLSLYMTKNSVYELKQGLHMTNTQLVENLKARREVVEEICRSAGVETKYRNLL